MLFKKILIGVLGGLVSGSLLAGTQGNDHVEACSGTQVTLPCEPKQWFLGVEALYLKPVYSSQREYLVHQDETFEAGNQWGWGFGLAGGYYFNQGNQLSLNWMHYDASSQRGQFPGTLEDFGESTFNLENNNRFDQVNAVLSQHVDLGIMKRARFYGGVQYANIRGNQRKVYAANNEMLEEELTGVTGFDEVEFRGVGPVIGVEYGFDLAPDFTLSANLASALLYGTSRYNAGLISAPNPILLSNTYASKKSVVPELEAKIGLNYKHQFALGALNLFGGYQVLQYFDALSLAGRNNRFESVDFGLFGPYLGFKWLGEV